MLRMQHRSQNMIQSNADIGKTVKQNRLFGKYHFNDYKPVGYTDLAIHVSELKSKILTTSIL